MISSGPIFDGVMLLPNRTLRVSFKPQTVSTAGLRLRTEGPVRQTCAVGRNQTRAIHVMPMTPVPASQCGGFELRVGDDGEWVPLGMLQLSADKRSILLPLSETTDGDTPMQLRYLWADWAVPTVYDARSYDGLNGELPAPPFVASVAQQ